MSAPTPILLLFAVVLALVVVGVIWGHRRARERREALQGLASRLGWRFDPLPDRDHDERYGHFGLFSRGHSRAAYNTLRGTMPWADALCHVIMGDFRFTVTQGSGKNRSSTTTRFSYLILHLPVPCPDLVIRPEGIFDKLKGAFGFDDIDFESEEFSRNFYVQCDDKRFAYAVCHPRMMEFLLQVRPPMIDIEQGRLCFGDGTREWSADQFEDALATVTRFLGQWPEHLLTELRASPAGVRRHHG